MTPCIACPKESVAAEEHVYLYTFCVLLLNLFEEINFDKMSTSITGDGRAAIERVLNPPPAPSISSGDGSKEDWETVFEIQRCLDWVKVNAFQKVCLQVADEYLAYSPRILEALEKGSEGVRFCILADSTYGSCCVDEKTAQHVPDSEAVIHFGQSCLTPCSDRFKVLYIFTKPFVDVDKLERLFEESFQKEEAVVIAFDVIYQCAAESLFQRVQHKYKSAQLSELQIPGETIIGRKDGFVRHGRFFPFDADKDCPIFYIGSRALPNLLLALPRCTFKVFDPVLPNDSVSTQTSTINKLLRKRNFYIEKVKDASSVGILVGTLVVQNYLSVIERLKSILRNVHKKFYVVSIGEINPCKLGNFMDIDCFVFVGCPEVVNYYISDECKGQFFQPIVTPYDIELAFCTPDTEPSVGPEYILDWAFLIEKGSPNVKNVEDDVSLITGGLRTAIVSENKDKTSANQVINWLGLDDNEESPSSDVNQIHQGRSGIAASYADEPLVK